MREKFGKTVEAGRVSTGPLASPAGESYGMFFLRHPRTMRRFKVIVSDGGVNDGPEWDHVSVSLVPSKRYPTWEEMCWIKDLFFDPSEPAFQIHPRVEDYVNDHPRCLHLWRPRNEVPLLPDPLMVGVGRKDNNK